MPRGLGWGGRIRPSDKEMAEKVKKEVNRVLPVGCRFFGVVLDGLGGDGPVIFRRTGAWSESDLQAVMLGLAKCRSYGIHQSEYLGIINQMSIFFTESMQNVSVYFRTGGSNYVLTDFSSYKCQIILFIYTFKSAFQRRVTVHTNMRVPTYHLFLLH